MNWVRLEKFKIPNRLLTLKGLCGHMEEAAGLHAVELGFSMEKLAERNLAWAVARMWLEIDEWPLAGEGAGADGEESITVKTWPVAADRLQYRRDFRVTGLVSARAVTDWVIINLASRRAASMPEFVTALQPQNPELVMPVGRPRLSGQEGAPELASFTVRDSDIDRNDHVNNACFVQWLADSAPAELRLSRRIKSLQILYRAEGRRGDTIVARGGHETGDVAEGSFLHGLFRAADGRELVRARSVYKAL
jgi:acyl-ACP thioesterase